MIQEKYFHSIQYWQYPLFNSIPDINHFISANNLHLQKGKIPGLNFSFNVEDDAEVVTENRRMLGEILFRKNTPVIIPSQTHSDHIGIVSKDTLDRAWEDTDALITNVPGIVIGVLSADCVPVLLADPVKRVVAAIHAGWKGTAKSIVRKTVEEMMRLYGCQPEDIRAGIGPSISGGSYEVGNDVALQFPNACIHPASEGKSCLDLWKANELQLLGAGVKKEYITRADICTYKNPDVFYSARRDSILTGRMVSALVLIP